MNSKDTSLVAILAARAFEATGIPYALVGSLASSIHGEPRGTLDVDFVTLMRGEQVERFHREVSKVFASDPVWMRDAVREQRTFQLVHIGSYIKVDIYVRSQSGPHALEVLRSQRINLGGHPGDVLNVASAEDTVLQKLAWYQEGGCVSDRQWRDVIGVLKMKGSSLDAAYLVQTAAALGVSELLQRAREQSGF